MAAEQGHANAQFQLGLLYRFGRGVPEDYVLPHMWFNLAASGPSSEDSTEQAAEARAKVANEMTPEDISEAHRLPVSGSRKSNRGAPEGEKFSRTKTILQ
jgi:TPR repeat protein